MPKIPTYSASLDYKPPRGNLDTAAMPGRMLAKFGESVGEFGETLMERQKAPEKIERERAASQAAQDNALKRALDEITRANSTAQCARHLPEHSHQRRAADHDGPVQGAGR